MLVRARIKKLEYLPEWAKCCEHSFQISGDDSIIIVDLDRQQDGSDGWCIHCRGYMPACRDVWVLADDNGPADWVPLDVLDLDEGPMQVQ